MVNELILTLAGIAFVNLLGWLSPGPNMLVVISSSVNRGRRAGVATAFGVSLGGMVWVILAMAGAATLFELFPRAVLMLRMAGAAYLFWLGVKHLRACRAGQGGEIAISKAVHSGFAAFRTGLLVNLTNPKAMIFFGSVFAAFIPAHAPLWQLLVIALFSQTQAFIQHCLTVWLFSSRAVMQGYKSANKAISAAIGTLYCGLGAGVAADALRRFC